MCGEAREVVKGKEKAVKDKSVDVRIPRVSICPVCQEAWKKNKDSEWYKFTHAISVPVVGIEVLSKDVKNETPIQKETLPALQSA